MSMLLGGGLSTSPLIRVFCFYYSSALPRFWYNARRLAKKVRRATMAEGLSAAMDRLVAGLMGLQFFGSLALNGLPVLFAMFVENVWVGLAMMYREGNHEKSAVRISAKSPVRIPAKGPCE